MSLPPLTSQQAIVVALVVLVISTTVIALWDARRQRRGA